MTNDDIKVAIKELPPPVSSNAVARRLGVQADDDLLRKLHSLIERGQVIAGSSSEAAFSSTPVRYEDLRLP